MGDGPVPAHRLVAVAAGRPVERRIEPAQPLHLAPGELSQVAEGMGEGLVGDRRLDVGRLRLHALVADRGELAEFVGHPAHLPAHAIGAGLAGVVRRQRLRRLADADLADRLDGIKQLLRPAADDGGMVVDGHGVSSWVGS